MIHDQSNPLEPNQSPSEAQPDSQLQPIDSSADKSSADKLDSSMDSEIDLESEETIESEETEETIAATISSEPTEGGETIAANVPPSEPISTTPVVPKESIGSSTSSSTASTTTSSSAPASAPESASTASKTQALFRLVGQLWGIFVAFLPIVGRFLRTVWKGVLTVLQWLYSVWKAILPRLRSRLPAGWNKLPDWVLTAVAVALLVFVLWLTAQLWPGKPPTLAGERTPPTLKAPAPVQPVAPTANDPALIARLQEQVAEITDSYADGLIQSVQASFRDDRLIVQLSDAWYTLDLASQNRLATELLARSRKLEFDKLEIVDSEGELLARSPVVGTKMVVYERLSNQG